MRFLLDTCTLLWWWSESGRLSVRVSAIIRDPLNALFVSAASAWEVSTKYRIGKYPGGLAVIEEWSRRLIESRISELPISAAHALRSGILPGNHRDPFDRMIAAQSIIENLPVLSPDSSFAVFGAERLW